MNRIFSFTKSSLKIGVHYTVYDVCGKEEGVIVDARLESGTHSFDFDAAMYSSGVYFYKLISEEQTLTGRFIIQH